MFGAPSLPYTCIETNPDLLPRSVGRDPAYFPDPEQFNPQRWLTKEGKIKEEMKSYPFGFGRRCLVFFLSFHFFAINSFILFL